MKAVDHNAELRHSTGQAYTQAAACMTWYLPAPVDVVCFLSPCLPTCRRPRTAVAAACRYCLVPARRVWPHHSKDCQQQRTQPSCFFRQGTSTQPLLPACGAGITPPIPFNGALPLSSAHTLPADSVMCRHCAGNCSCCALACRLAMRHLLPAPANCRPNC